MIDFETRLRFDRNLLEAIREFARWQPASMVLEDDGVLLVSGGTAFPVGFTNCALRTDPSVPAEVLCERAQEFFASQQRGYTIWVREGLDDDVEAHLVQQGLRSCADAPWLFLAERPAPPALPPDATVRLTRGEADLAAIRTILGEAFEQLGTPPAETEAIFGKPSQILNAVTRFAIAHVDGTPAATAMVLLSGGMGGVYWVGTRRAFGRRGLGAACTTLVAEWAFDAGAPLIGLHATPMGLPVYERMGFVGNAGAHRWYVMA